MSASGGLVVHISPDWASADQLLASTVAVTEVESRYGTLVHGTPWLHSSGILPREKPTSRESVRIRYDEVARGTI